ncbi:hypothetical protein GCM10010503_30850 [Streptomyces lucensis JCM 4490]|uniref:Uncharacterized protein n=1 Tax=Streptomyces lucensis JCM 4490 TaxID=1306176 RepID=A0A918J6E7_9ACTN|nr:hypothetical protein [Streptomyces lucensis]GGW51804.1 hypothetical protein GCM10010503_30850 [Streptomyces lucensis JCM 4490]
MGSNDLPPYAPTTPKGKPAACPETGITPPQDQTGTPAAGAGSRWTSCGPVSSCADEDGSADGGSDAGGGVVEAGGSGGTEVGSGVVSCPVDAGPPGFTVLPGLAGTEEALPFFPDGVADADADPPRFALPP